MTITPETWGRNASRACEEFLRQAERGNLYLARIYVTLKPTVNDPQGQTVLGSLRNLGFSPVADVRVGKYLEVRVDEADASRAEAMVTEMCQKLLANPVIEQFRFDLEAVPAAVGGQNPPLSPLL